MKLPIDIGTFQNDMTTFKSKDDILTLLIHLGYLAYDENTRTVFIPNEEVKEEFVRAIKTGKRPELIKAIEASERLLDATIQELPTGNGYADMVFLPLKHSNKPAMIVELKWDKSAKGAIEQVKNKNYFQAIEKYSGEILLVGINYDKNSKKHECVIEKYKK